MFKFLGFGRQQPAPARSERSTAESAPTTRQHTDIQRELVRVVLKDTLRNFGIPAAWLGCDVTALSGRARGQDLLVRLVVQKWDERLLPFLPALQKMLVVGLDRFEPSIDHSGYVISWQFAPDCGCPHQNVPGASFWADPAPAAAPAAVAQAAKPKFDLPPSMWEKPAGPVTAPAPFAATEPTPLAQAPNQAPVTASQAPASEKPKFDLPPSAMDHLPSAYAKTEHSPLT